MSSDREFQLDFLFRTAAEGILLTRPDGRLARINPAAAAMLGLTPDDVLGEPAARLLRAQPALVRLLTASGDQQDEIPLPHRRTAVGVGVDRPNGGRIVLLHDVTERAALEMRRETLIRQVAHDLRNPLNALFGYADLVTRFGTLNADQRKYLDRVRLTAQKLYDLSESLVDLAWIEAGMALDHRPFELAHLIHLAVHQLEAEAEERRITLVVSVQQPIPPIVGDPRRITEAITRLLENAVRYSLPDSNVAIHAWQEGPRVFCTVGDQGIGIAAEDLPNIFDRLWRSPDERVRSVPGGGIGLTLARAIVRRHGGQIWADSTPGEGTTVTFMLPLAEGW